MSPIRPVAFIALFLCTSIFLSSCATILNGPAQKIRIASEKDVTDVRVERSLPADSLALPMGNTASYIVPRSSGSLIIHYRVDDTAEKTLSVRPRNSLAFWINISLTYGIGLLIDWNNPKRYSYPAWTYLKANDSAISHHWFPSTPKHTLRLSLTYSPVNMLSLWSPKGRSVTGGPFGFEAGLDYFYKKDRYVSMTAGAGTNAAPVDHIGLGYYDLTDALYANIRNNYAIGTIDLGYGLNIIDYEWTRITQTRTATLRTSANTVALGLSLAAQCRISYFFRIGLLYQPDLINTTRSPVSNYQHYIAVQLCWKLPLHTPSPYPAP